MDNSKLIYRISTSAPEQFTISHNRPEGVPAPKTVGQLQYLPGVGIQVTMRCYEEKPRAIYYNPNSPIYTDSCMEVYIDCFPEIPQMGYLNLEMNVNGAAYCSFGTARHTRSVVVNMGIPHPEVEATRGVEDGQAYWQVECLLPASLFEGLYHRPFAFEPGHRMRGNFYKCGDHTATPHWASWAPVDRLDFHDPASFGTFELCD